MAGGVEFELMVEFVATFAVYGPETGRFEGAMAVREETEGLGGKGAVYANRWLS
jgi:hypothetical protein